MTATEYVILVDQFDNEIGSAEKLSAHRQNLMHRAFSIFLKHEHNPQLLLLQQRALDKYHSPGLWTNTCCSHPRQNEDILSAGRRRLKEELGFTTELQNIGSFHYIAHFENGLSENELDHVLIGQINDQQISKPNPNEVQALRWVHIDDLQQELSTQPQLFTPWLAQALAMVINHQQLP
jgi:isopentenyl-diphosphate Delta-isomerase